MSDTETGLSKRFEEQVTAVNDVRIEIGVPTTTASDLMLLKDTLKLSKDNGKLLVVQQHGAESHSYELAEAVEKQLRLSGISSTNAENSSEIISRVGLVPNGERVPVLFVGSYYDKTSTSVVLFGTEMDKAPYLKVVNNHVSQEPYLMIEYPYPYDISTKEAMRADGPNKPWLVGFQMPGPRLDNVDIVDDPDEFKVLNYLQRTKSIVLVGASAVAEVLPTFNQINGTKTSIEIVRNLVLRTIDGDTETKISPIGDEDLSLKVRQMLELHAIYESRYEYPAGLHHHLLEEYDPVDLKSEFLYALYNNPSLKVVSSLGSELLSHVGISESKTQISSYTYVVKNFIHRALEATAYKESGAVVNSIAPEFLEPVVVDMMRKYLDTKSAVTQRRARKLYQVIDQLDQQVKKRD